MQQKNQYLLCITLLLSFLHYCTSNDTISQNQAFKDGDTLVSSESTFAFGFFSPGNSKNRYLGIWYNKVSEQTVVWVANRNSPIINGTTGILSLETHGNLVLRDQKIQNKNSLLWSTNVSSLGTANSSFVQLLETGNLVLFKDVGIISWQSFDYPTDTHLPHMKLGVNRASGLPWSLTSWKSRDDPGTGDFQFKMVLNGSPQFFLFKNSEKLWRSGPWNGVHLSGVPDMTSKFIFSIDYVEDEDEVSLSYMIHNPNIFSRLALNESGTLERLTWQEAQHSWIKFWAAPKEQCDYNSHCGKFSNCDPYKYGEFECECLPGYEPKEKSEWFLRNSVNGCIRKPGELPACGSVSSDDPGGFIKLASVKVPDTINSVVNRVSGLKECADSCLKNCSCTAYSSANISNGGSGCISWYSELMDMRQFSNRGQDVYIRVSSSELTQYLKNLKGGKRSKKWIIMLVAYISAFLVLAFVICVFLKRRKGKGTRRKNINSLLSFNLRSPASASSYGGSSSMKKEIDDSNRDLSMYDLKTLVSATDCFALSNKLGQGGFGSVYKGRLHDGREIAIKRLSKSSGQGTEEFKNEVTLIARLQHRNLVRLLGCCIQQEEKMLVYEYLPNKGLDYFIFDDERRASLDWRKRFEIILGIARGIVYLHRDSRLKIIHRDLKASNVLLDANMDPKISDFGMARIFGADQMEEQTLRVVGTYGYMSPEYAMLGLFSEKSDVFSYGVLLLEIISGKKNNSYFSDNSVNLIGYVWELWKEGNMALEIVDEAILGESYNQDEVARCIRIGLLCVQEQAMDRPTMSEVLSMLCNETSVPSTSPKEPAYVIKNGKNDGHKYNLPYSSSASIGTSVDSATITVLQAR